MKQPNRSKRNRKNTRAGRITIKGNKHKGLSGEHRARSDAVQRGYITAKPDESDLLGYDLIIDDGKRLYRVEVKSQDSIRKSKITGEIFKDRVMFNLYRRNNRGNTLYDYIDYFALYWVKFDKIAWVSKCQANGHGKMTIKHSEFKLYELPQNNNFEQVKKNDIEISQLTLFNKGETE